MKQKFMLIIVLIMITTTSLFAQPHALWIKAIGDSSCYFTSVDVTGDGGFILAGPTTGETFGIVRTNSDGDTLWTSSVGMGPDVDNPKIMQTSDSGYLVASGGDPWLVKLDTDGVKLWEQARVNIGLDTASAFNGYRLEAMVELADGSVIFSGACQYDNYYNMFVKTNATGEILWAKSFGRGSAMSLIQNSSGELVSAGMFPDPNEGGWKMGMMRLSESGDSLSTVLYSSAISDTLDYQLLSIEETTDKGYIMAGRAGDNDNVQRYYVVLADSIGTMVWEKIYGGDYQGEAYFASQVGDEFLISGVAVNLSTEIMGPWTLLLDSSGDSIWTSDFNQSDGIVFSGKKISEGEYALAGGYIYSFEPWKSNGLLLRLSFNTNDVTQRTLYPSQYRLIQNYPNPFNPGTIISYVLPVRAMVNLTIFDMKGRKVTTLKNLYQNPGQYEVQWSGVDATGHPVGTGTYFARLQAGDHVKTIKMVFLK